MYKVKLTDDLYFTGSYSTIGGNGILVPFLPPMEDLDKQKFYKLNQYESQTGVNKIPVMVQAKDEEGNLLWEDSESTIPKMIQDADEEGNPIFTEEPIIENITEWIFDEVDYNKWKAEQDAIVPEPTDKEKIELLTNKLTDVNRTIDSIMLDILPEIAGI